jgi:hypothetical protein
MRTLCFINLSHTAKMFNKVALSTILFIIIHKNVFNNTIICTIIYNNLVVLSIESFSRGNAPTNQAFET